MPRPTAADRNMAGGGFTCGQVGWRNMSYSFTGFASLRGVDAFTVALDGRAIIGDSSARDLPAFRVILELEGRRVTERGDFVLGGRDERGDDELRAISLQSLRGWCVDGFCACLGLFCCCSRSLFSTRAAPLHAHAHVQ